MMETWLPQKLRLLRVRQGLTLVEAAEKTGVSRATLSSLERGHSHPVAPTLVKIAKGYDIPVEELLEEPELAGKAEAPPTPWPEAGLTRDEQIIEGLIAPWVAWLKRDTRALEQLVVTPDVHEKLSRDRRNVVAALDEVGDALEALGIDWGDRSNRAMRRAHDALLWAFGEWHGLSIEASAAYLDSRARVEEERHIPRIFKAVA
jgi:transcriptional regulator with XRE-family HTH domain